MRNNIMKSLFMCVLITTTMSSASREKRGKPVVKTEGLKTVENAQFVPSVPKLHVGDYYGQRMKNGTVRYGFVVSLKTKKWTTVTTPAASTKSSKSRKSRRLKRSLDITIRFLSWEDASSKTKLGFRDQHYTCPGDFKTRHVFKWWGNSRPPGPLTDRCIACLSSFTTTKALRKHACERQCPKSPDGISFDIKLDPPAYRILREASQREFGKRKPPGCLSFFFGRCRHRRLVTMEHLPAERQAARSEAELHP